MEAQKTLLKYFTDVKDVARASVGAEVETQFVNKNGNAISLKQSQAILQHLVDSYGWIVESKKSSIITSIQSPNSGSRVLYELGRHNMELATNPFFIKDRDELLHVIERDLSELYRSADIVGASPYQNPHLDTEDDLLVIPDERDETWLKLDGRKALNLLTKVSSVQFTISVSRDNAIKTLDKLADNIEEFLKEFPQDSIWKRYILESFAKYRTDRYGGPLRFSSLMDYVRKLSDHYYIQGNKLLPVSKVTKMDISLYLRSIWWHFRLKKYNKSLCIEVRPQGRYSDAHIPKQLEKVLDLTQ